RPREGDSRVGDLLAAGHRGMLLSLGSGEDSYFRPRRSEPDRYARDPLARWRRRNASRRRGRIPPDRGGGTRHRENGNRRSPGSVTGSTKVPRRRSNSQNPSPASSWRHDEFEETLAHLGLDRHP